MPSKTPGKTPSKTPNSKLAYWFTRSGWNKHELARLITQQAHETGHRHVCTDATRVRRWLGGERPRDPIPGILAELFTDRFGHPVTADMLGLGGPRTALTRGGSQEIWTPSRTVLALDDFSRSELMLNRRGFLGVGLGASVPSGLNQPLQHWFTVDPEPAPHDHGRIGLSEIEQIERAIEAYRQWDNEHGGGVHRKAVAAHLNEVSDLLATPRPEPVAGRLFGAAAELAEIAGWMAHDVGRQATAQRYFTLAVQAAHEAGDELFAAEVLSRMARQMIHLQRPGDALDIIHRAQLGAARRTDATATTCLLYALEARAHAGLGAVQAVHTAVGRAEESQVRAEPGEDPVWIRYFDAAELAGCIGDSYRVLSQSEEAQAARAETYIQRALEERHPQYVRCRALDLSALAVAQFAKDEPEQACETGQTALALVGRLSSARVGDRLRELKAQAARFSGIPAVTELTERIGGVLVAAPA